MSTETKIHAIWALACIIMALICLGIGVGFGISHMKWEAARYGHAEWYRSSGYDRYQWRWLPAQQPHKYDLREPVF